MIGFGLMFALMSIPLIVLVGLVLNWAIAMYLSEREASIASFSAVVGNSLGLLFFVNGLDLLAVIELACTIFGLSLLWWYLFKRETARG